MNEKPRIMIVEDEEIVSFDLKKTLEKMGYNVTAQASSGVEAIEKAENFKPDIILMDIRLKNELDGIDAAHIISFKRRVPIIYLTSYGNEEVRKRAKQTFASAFLLKPFDEENLKMTIDKALSEHPSKLLNYLPS
ncbi:MAG TPA: response regulator [Ignavibacteriaceae bacterium]|nr:response regulator [Ignavibacteriaceae bacterium]